MRERPSLPATRRAYFFASALALAASFRALTPAASALLPDFSISSPLPRRAPRPLLDGVTLLLHFLAGGFLRRIVILVAGLLLGLALLLHFGALGLLGVGSLLLDVAFLLHLVPLRLGGAGRASLRDGSGKSNGGEQQGGADQRTNHRDLLGEM